MKRFLLTFICLLGFFASVTATGNNIADDEKPDIVGPVSIHNVT